MPDGSCYEIKYVLETTPLAFLKDRGEGLHFKVRAVLIEAPESYCDHFFTQHETYLYFTDNFFCGKSFIDGRYNHKDKEFIPVTLDVFPDCSYELVYFEARGKRYAVNKTISVEPRGSFHAGGVGILHKVEARQVSSDAHPDSIIIRMAALYLEVNKWFVRVKAS